MPRYWHPDEKFLEFLEWTQKTLGVEIRINGKSLVSEMRDGTDMGRDAYDAMYGDPLLQDGFEDWKKMQKP